MATVPRLLTSLLVVLLRLLPARGGATPSAPRARRAPRSPSHRGPDDDQVPVEAQARARVRTLAGHRWRGEIVFEAGPRRTVASGEWRLAHGWPLGALVRHGPAPRLDPAVPEALAAELEALLTLQVPGARLSVTHADGDGWRRLEVRVPTSPETVVQLDRAAVAGVFGCAPGTVRVALRVLA